MSKQDESPDTSKTSYIRLQRTIGPHGRFIDRYISIKPGPRMAKCVQCSLVTKSDEQLPMFEPKELLDFDAYFCGCCGFD